MGSLRLPCEQDALLVPLYDNGPPKMLIHWNKYPGRFWISVSILRVSCGYPNRIGGLSLQGPIVFGMYEDYPKLIVGIELVFRLPWKRACTGEPHQMSETEFASHGAPRFERLLLMARHEFNVCVAWLVSL